MATWPMRGTASILTSSSIRSRLHPSRRLALQPRVPHSQATVLLLEPPPGCVQSVHALAEGTRLGP